MSKQLRFNHDGKEYVLEFTRKSVMEMERKGFIASEITDKPMTNLPILFAGAFLAHHKNMKKELIDAIYSRIENREELIGKLAEMYNEPIMTLIEDPEPNEGNVHWTANW